MDIFSTSTALSATKTKENEDTTTSTFKNLHNKRRQHCRLMTNVAYPCSNSWHTCTEQQSTNPESCLVWITRKPLTRCSLVTTFQVWNTVTAIFFHPAPYRWELMFPSMLCWSTNHTVSSSAPVKRARHQCRQTGTGGKCTDKAPVVGSREKLPRAAIGENVRMWQWVL